MLDVRLKKMSDPTSEFLKFPARAVMFYALGFAGTWLGSRHFDTPALFWPVAGFELSPIVGVLCLVLGAFVFMRAVVMDSETVPLMAVLFTWFLFVGLFSQMSEGGLMIAGFVAFAVSLAVSGSLILRRAGEREGTKKT